MDEYIKWIDQSKIPENVKKILLNNTFTKTTQLGSVSFDTPKNIIGINTDYFEVFPNWLDNKLIIIGSALNGDGWVINYRHPKVTTDVYPHDNIPDDGIIPDERLIKVANSLEEFIDLAKADKLPFDYYEAEEKLSS